VGGSATPRLSRGGDITTLKAVRWFGQSGLTASLYFFLKTILFIFIFFYRGHVILSLVLTWWIDSFYQNLKWKSRTKSYLLFLLPTRSFKPLYIYIYISYWAICKLMKTHWLILYLSLFLVEYIYIYIYHIFISIYKAVIFLFFFIFFIFFYLFL
jgi:hypothetical protein